MRAIIISDNDYRAFLDQLKIAGDDKHFARICEGSGVSREQAQRIFEAAYEHFRNVAARWFQDQGATDVR